MMALRYNHLMFEKIEQVLSQGCKLVSDQPLLVGVSGGPDSLVLLDILDRLAYPLIVAHLNHGLRPEASDDARFVEQSAETLGVRFVLERVDAGDFAKQNALSVEEAARQLRYRFLFEQAEKYSAQAVAVGHNADDQVETVLMHLLRGSGLDGLTGMQVCSLPNTWNDTIPLVRPLLFFWREEILAYCKTHDLNPVVDHTNLDPKYFRNRLRYQLIPELDTYIPGIRTRLFQTADLLAADRALLDQLTDQAWHETIRKVGEIYINLQLSTFNLQPLGLRRRLARKAITHLRPTASDVDFAMVRRLLDFSDHPTATCQTDLGLGLRLSVEGDNFFISEWNAFLPAEHWPLITEHFSLPIPCELDLVNGWLLRASFCLDVESAKEEAHDNQDPLRAWIDLGNRQPILNVRPRLPGERFQPLGMGSQSMKLSDFMINQKIPQRARENWPIICLDDEIVWLPGYRLAHPFRLTEKSQRVVFLQLTSK
jgi:tRNA(Ile)-lysidine synthase